MSTPPRSPHGLSYSRQIPHTSQPLFITSSHPHLSLPNFHFFAVVCYLRYYIFSSNRISIGSEQRLSYSPRYPMSKEQLLAHSRVAECTKRQLSAEAEDKKWLEQHTPPLRLQAWVQRAQEQVTSTGHCFKLLLHKCNKLHLLSHHSFCPALAGLQQPVGCLTWVWSAVWCCKSFPWCETGSPWPH
jgi:hypothetical protein